MYINYMFIFCTHIHIYIYMYMYFLFPFLVWNLWNTYKHLNCDYIRQILKRNRKIVHICDFWIWISMNDRISVDVIWSYGSGEPGGSDLRSSQRCGGWSRIRRRRAATSGGRSYRRRVRARCTWAGGRPTPPASRDGSVCRCRILVGVSGAHLAWGSWPRQRARGPSAKCSCGGSVWLVAAPDHPTERRMWRRKMRRWWRWKRSCVFFETWCSDYHKHWKKHPIILHNARMIPKSHYHKLMIITHF